MTDNVPRWRRWDLSKSIVIHPAFGELRRLTDIGHPLPIKTADLPVSWTSRSEADQEAALLDQWRAVCQLCDLVEIKLYVSCTIYSTCSASTLQEAGLQRIGRGFVGGCWPEGRGERLFELPADELTIFTMSGKVLFQMYEGWDSLIVASPVFGDDLGSYVLTLSDGTRFGVDAID